MLFNGDYSPYSQRSLLIGGGRDTGYLGGGGLLDRLTFRRLAKLRIHNTKVQLKN